MSNTREWLASPLGSLVLEEEIAVSADLLSHMFGLQLVQLGEWGQPGALISQARTAYASVVAECAPCAASGEREGISLVCDPAHLALAPASVDVVMLPHTLELHEMPHQVLREAERVLVGEGRLLVFGFNPVSLWGVRRLASRGRFPAGARRLIAEHRLRDWLTLLGFEIDTVVYHSHRLPVHNSGAGGDARLERLRPAMPPGVLAGGYVLVARKRVYSMTPVRPVLVPKKVIVGGLVSSVPRDGVAAMDKPPADPAA